MNCFASFVRKEKDLRKEKKQNLIFAQIMATWDDFEMYGCYIKDNGLKVCPFNSTHRVKPSKYSKHIMKCEQIFPKTTSLRRSSSGLNSIKSNDSMFGSQSNVGSDEVLDVNSFTNSMNQLSTSSDDSHKDYLIEPQTSLQLKPLPRTDSTDSAIAMTCKSDSREDNGLHIEVEVHDSAHHSEDHSQDLTLTYTHESEEASSQVLEVTTTHALDETTAQVLEELAEERNNSDNRDIEPQIESTTNTTNERSAETQLITIVPQEMTAVRGQAFQSLNDNRGSGDVDDDDWTGGQPYSLYQEFENFNDMTDEQIMEMAYNFLNVVVVSKMSKTQRRKLNEKLIGLRNAEKQLKIKAFNELLAFKDVWDPNLKQIPQEIRKPRIDVRDLFNLKDKRIDTLKSTTPVSPPKECAPNRSTNRTSPEIQPLNSLDESDESALFSVTCSKTAPKEDLHQLTAVCNSCWDSLSIDEESLKRMTIFCSQCSGIKFGGYFECHSCKLYGYFANSQITQHLSKHFPQNN